MGTNRFCKPERPALVTADSHYQLSKIWPTKTSSFPTLTWRDMEGLFQRSHTHVDCPTWGLQIVGVVLLEVSDALPTVHAIRVQAMQQQ